jgi:hypothetical protein
MSPTSSLSPFVSLHVHLCDVVEREASKVAVDARRMCGQGQTLFVTDVCACVCVRVGCCARVLSSLFVTFYFLFSSGESHRVHRGHLQIEGRRKAIQSFTRWLNTVLLPECYLRPDGPLLTNSLGDNACLSYLIPFTVAGTQTSTRFLSGHWRRSVGTSRCGMRHSRLDHGGDKR